MLELDRAPDGEWSPRMIVHHLADSETNAYLRLRKLLGLLGDDDWGKAGTHSESGGYSVERWLEIYADHGDDHADQIARARTGAA